uniref:uncharacterized protein LOC129516023 isoform X2 n=1 Tax=Nyctereutes procyonoides TaxID=34880 RepID=UPI002443A959|nr:uncharacterized protein LOC129516023 isoform X2 [Nyctereutes procyonoides]
MSCRVREEIVPGTRGSLARLPGRTAEGSRPSPAGPERPREGRSRACSSRRRTTQSERVTGGHWARFRDPTAGWLGDGGVASRRLPSGRAPSPDPSPPSCCGVKKAPEAPKDNSDQFLAQLRSEVERREAGAEEARRPGVRMARSEAASVQATPTWRLSAALLPRSGGVQGRPDGAPASSPWTTIEKAKLIRHMSISQAEGSGMIPQLVPNFRSQVPAANCWQPRYYGDRHYLETHRAPPSARALPTKAPSPCPGSCSSTEGFQWLN